MTEFTFDTTKPETVFNAMLAAFGMPASPAPAPKSSKPAKRAVAKSIKRAPRKVSAPIEPANLARHSMAMVDGDDVAPTPAPTHDPVETTPAPARAGSRAASRDLTRRTDRRA